MDEVIVYHQNSPNPLKKAGMFLLKELQNNLDPQLFYAVFIGAFLCEYENVQKQNIRIN